MGVALDLDGVIWLADEPIPGSARAVVRLREAGEQLVFVTNNSSLRVADVEAKLARHGVAAQGEVVTSAMAAATLVDAGERVLVVGGPGVVEALERRGAVPVTEGVADAVLVGFDRGFDYERLRIAAAAVHHGARLLATNDDPTYPTPHGPIPGGGAILAAVVAATGASVEVAGKPYAPMTALVRDRLGSDATMIGDRADTDGRFAQRLGYRFGLVHTGVTGSDEVVQPVPDLSAADLASLVDQLLDSGWAGPRPPAPC
jgi:4-nitrophenyl phosphatase